MKILNPLNKKQAKEILNKIQEQFNCETKDILENYYLYLTKDNKINIVNKDIAKIDIKNLKVMNIGLYFCKIEKDGIRLSIEGSQILKNSKKNIIELNNDQYLKWMKGESLDIEESNGYKLIKHEKDFLGTGKIINNTLYNYTPKERRAKENIKYLI